MSKILVMVCGPAGAGKSTWIEKQIEKSPVKCAHVSRDAVRFSIVSEDEDYFSHEKEVFDAYANELNKKILDNETAIIYADATHLTEKSRNKVLDCLVLDDVQINVVNFMTPYIICQAYNNKRKETRSFVPQSVIRRMTLQFEPAKDGEKYSYANIFDTRDMEE